MKENSMKTLLRGYPKLQRSALRVLRRHFDINTAEEINNGVLTEYRKIAKEVLYIGGSGNPLTSTLIFSAQLLSYIMLLKGKGIETDTIGTIIYEIGEETVKSFSSIIIKLGKILFFSPVRLSKLSKRAKESQKKEYAGNWVYSFTMDSKTKYSLDYHECGIQKLFKEFGYEEFVKYICKLDFLISDKLGVKLERSKTIGNGDDICDFRYCKL